MDVIVEQWRRERPDLDPTAKEITGRIVRLASLFQQAYAATFEPLGLNEGDYGVLAPLRRAGAPNELTPTELAKHRMMTSGGMTAAFDRLERKGLVVARPQPRRPSRQPRSSHRHRPRRGRRSDDPTRAHRTTPRGRSRRAGTRATAPPAPQTAEHHRHRVMPRTTSLTAETISWFERCLSPHASMVETPRLGRSTRPWGLSVAGTGSTGSTGVAPGELQQLGGRLVGRRVHRCRAATRPARWSRHRHQREACRPDRRDHGHPEHFGRLRSRPARPRALQVLTATMPARPTHGAGEETAP